MSGPYRDASRRPEDIAAGDATPWELKTWTSDRSCPVCAIPLFAASKDGYRIDACGKCGGSWMVHAHLRQMIDTENRTPIDLVRMSDAIARPLVTPSETPTCPECKLALVRETLAGVEIDVCDNHGTWFDRAELEQVATALIKDYGPRAQAAAARAAAPPVEEPLVDIRNVAIGVATVGLALVGVAFAPKVELDVFGRAVETDVLGNKVLKR